MLKTDDGLKPQYTANLSLLHAPFVLGLTQRRHHLLVHRRIHSGCKPRGPTAPWNHQEEHQAGRRGKASVEDSKKVVEICTKYAQKGNV